MHRFAFDFAFAFAVVAFAFGGCATSRQVAAQQQNAIGGGFVAVGVTTTVAGTVSALVTLAVLSSGFGVTQPEISNLALVVVGGVVVNSAIITAGVMMMKMAEPDLEQPPSAEAAETPSPAFNEDD